MKDINQVFKISSYDALSPSIAFKYVRNKSLIIWWLMQTKKKLKCIARRFVLTKAKLPSSFPDFSCRSFLNISVIKIQNPIILFVFFVFLTLLNEYYVYHINYVSSLVFSIPAPMSSLLVALWFFHPIFTSFYSFLFISLSFLPFCYFHMNVCIRVSIRDLFFILLPGCVGIWR